MMGSEYDAIVVGAGPNGLAAAITLRQAGLSVLLIEGSDKPGGGLRTEELTLPGYYHDRCSAIHPLAASSPFFSQLPLDKYGLEFIDPPVAAAHPFDDGTAAVLTGSVEDTARLLGRDRAAYQKLIGDLVGDWPAIAPDVLGPLRVPREPWPMLRFGLKAIQAASRIADRFATKEARGLWAGMAGHSILPLRKPLTSAIGMVLMALAHHRGWPVPKGGSQAIANSMLAYFEDLGGETQTGVYVRSLSELPRARALLFDVTPRQMLSIAGDRLSPMYSKQLRAYRYGMGVFKIDYALDGPVPFRAEACGQAGTVHLGNTFEEIAQAEYQSYKGRHPEKPFVLLAQQSLFDQTRAPEGKHTLWAYCHVPRGSTVDMSEAIEKQIERFAPGFRDRVIARHTMNTREMEAYNPNYVGGDINGGVISPRQLFTRPSLSLSPYRTSVKGLYFCSSSTPPGGGVHGMCGYHAAARALKDEFGLKVKPL